VAVRDKNKLGFKLTPLITPLPAKIAATRAKRQADELAEVAKRQKKLKPDATPQPQTTGATAVDFEAFVLAPNTRTEPVRRLG